MRLRPGLTPDPAGGAYSAPSHPWFKGPNPIRGGERKGNGEEGKRGKGKAGKGKGKEGEGRGWRGRRGQGRLTLMRGRSREKGRRLAKAGFGRE